MKLENALKFLEEIDKLKDTYRQCLVMSGEREENTAEHSFSLAMAALTLSPFANEEIDVLKTMKMALFHDIVEVYAGDNFHYHKDAKEDLKDEETKALMKVLAPIGESEQAKEMVELWHEFEDGDSKESKFLRGVDRFLPMYHNFKTNGHSWVRHGITKEQALDKNSHIEDSSKEIWQFTKEMLDESQSKGWIG